MGDVIREKHQAGIEVTRGTDIPATRLVYANITRNVTKPLREFSDRSGTFEDRRRQAFGRLSVAYTASDLATFEDLAWWFQLALKGGVTGVTDGGSPPAYAYTFVPSLATDDLKSITLEKGQGSIVHQSTQVMVNSWTLRIDPDNEGAWIFDAELLGRDFTSASFTGSISDRTTEVIPAPGTKIYIDGTTIGTTQITDRFISASISGNNNIHYKAFAEHVETVAANKVGRGARRHDAQVTLEFDSVAELDDFIAGDQQFIRFESESEDFIHTTVPKSATIDLNGYWTTVGWGDREGNIIATFGIAAFYNASSGYSLSAEIVNALSTLP